MRPVERICPACTNPAEAWSAIEAGSVPEVLSQVDVVFQRRFKRAAVSAADLPAVGDWIALDLMDSSGITMPQAAILEFGANDCYQGVPVEETEKALSDMIHGLLGAGVAS